MNAENRHRRDERQLLEDFDRETARLLGEASHAIEIMERLGDQEYRARHGGHAKGGRASARSGRKRAGWAAQPPMRLTRARP